MLIRTGATIGLLASAATTGAGLGSPIPTLAQEQVSWVLASVNAVCRADPSPSADVSSVLGPSGVRGAFGRPIEVAGSDTSEVGQVWYYVPRTYRWPETSGECWLPASVLIPSQGTETDLLHIADRMLAAPDGHGLMDWVAVHNLFIDPWIREGISPAFHQRRVMLLERALEAAEDDYVITDWLADRDPLMLAWLESLGAEADGIGYPKQEEASPAPTPESREVATIASDVACRHFEPFPTAVWYSRTLRLDFHFFTERSDTVVAGDVWTHVKKWDCWVKRSLTAPADGDEHVVAIVDRFFSGDQGRSVSNTVRTYNVLTSQRFGHPDALERSPMLILRRLQLLEAWLWTTSSRSADQFTVGVVHSLGKEVSHIDYGARWKVLDQAYLDLYGQHRGQPVAHETLWTLATRRISHDCEGDLECYLKVAVFERPVRYWTEYPRGHHLTKAVGRVLDVIDSVLAGCQAAQTTDPNTLDEWREFAGWNPRGAEAVRRLRASLTELDPVAKAPLVESLNGLETCATLPESLP